MIRFLALDFLGLAVFTVARLALAAGGFLEAFDFREDSLETGSFRDFFPAEAAGLTALALDFKALVFFFKTFGAVDFPDLPAVFTAFAVVLTAFALRLTELFVVFTAFVFCRGLAVFVVFWVNVPHSR